MKMKKYHTFQLSIVYSASATCNYMPGPLTLILLTKLLQIYFNLQIFLKFIFQPQLLLTLYTHVFVFSCVINVNYKLQLSCSVHLVINYYYITFPKLIIVFVTLHELIAVLKQYSIWGFSFQSITFYSFRAVDFMERIYACSCDVLIKIAR